MDETIGELVSRLQARLAYTAVPQITVFHEDLRRALLAATFGLGAGYEEQQ